METLKLDGREFTGISESLTASQDDYILAHLRLAGAIEILGDILTKRTSEQKAEDLLTQVLVSGRTYLILAGCLTEAGHKWNRLEADRNAAAFAQITDVAEKTAMRQAIVRFIIGFLQLGEPSQKSSPRSSSRNAKGRPTASAAPETSATSHH